MNKLYHKEVIVKNVTQSTFNYTFHDLKPYTMYSITIYASNSKHEGDKAVSNYTTAEISELEQTFYQFNGIHFLHREIFNIHDILYKNL